MKTAELEVINTHRKIFLDERIIESEVRAVILGGMGYSHKLIAEQTGLSPARIALRLKRAGVKLSDWRDGKNAIAKTVIHAVKVDAVGVAKKLEEMIFENRLLQESQHQERLAKGPKQLEDSMKRHQIAPAV